MSMPPFPANGKGLIMGEIYAYKGAALKATPEGWTKAVNRHGPKANLRALKLDNPEDLTLVRNLIDEHREHNNELYAKNVQDKQEETENMNDLKELTMNRFTTHYLKRIFHQEDDKIKNSIFKVLKMTLLTFGITTREELQKNQDKINDIYIKYAQLKLALSSYPLWNQHFWNNLTKKDKELYATLLYKASKVFLQEPSAVSSSSASSSSASAPSSSLDDIVIKSKFEVVEEVLNSVKSVQKDPKLSVLLISILDHGLVHGVLKKFQKL